MCRGGSVAIALAPLRCQVQRAAVAQLEARFPDLREPEADARLAPAARLAAALLRVSERAGGPRGERLVLRRHRRLDPGPDW